MGGLKNLRALPSAVIQTLENRVLLATLDPTWNGTGVQGLPYAPKNPGDYGFVKSLAPLSGGKVLALAYVQPSGRPGADALIRYNSNGSLDSTFGDGGILAIRTGSASDMVVRDDGTLVLAVTVRDPDGDDEAFADIRNPDGSPADFHSLHTETTFDGWYDTIGDVDLALAGDGGFVAAWSVSSHSRTGDPYADRSDYYIAVRKLDSGNDNFEASLYASYSALLNGLAALPDGSVIVSNDGTLERIKPDGSIDAQFARDEEGSYTLGRVDHFAVQSDGKILFLEGNRPTRVNPNGTRDTAYGDAGFGDAAPLDAPESLVTVDDNGGLVAVSYGLLMRWNPNGTLDSSFAAGSALPTGTNDPRAIAVQGDGKILVGTEPFSVVRVDDDAALQPVAVAGGTLTVAGTTGADTITISQEQANIAVVRNGTKTTHPAATVQRLKVIGGSGNNAVTINVALPAEVFGGPGNNRITTAAGDDSILTGAGNDTIDTGDGFDHVTSAAGDDAITLGDWLQADDLDQSRNINAGAGNDTITTGKGSDSIDTGDGNNRVITGALADFMSGGEGPDHIELPQGTVYGNSGDDTIIGGDGGIEVNDRYGKNSITTGAGNDKIWASDEGEVISCGGGDDLVHAGGGNDTVDAGAGNDVIYAETGDDDLYGDDGNDKIFAGYGDDIIRGWGGDDTVDADNGNDWVLGGDGADKVAGGDGDDTLGGGAQKDTLDGGMGTDRLNGHGGHDRLYGGAGVDRLYGYDGNDSLDGGSSGDRLYGGAGVDSFYGQSGADRIFAKDGEADQLFGGKDKDTAEVDAGDVLASIETASM
jgi:uncharacterized delta-60 repeat protein